MSAANDLEIARRSTNFFVIHTRIDLLFTMSENTQQPSIHKTNCCETYSRGRRIISAPNSNTHSSHFQIQSGGARRDRTDDLLLAKQALSQLSYGPEPEGKIKCQSHSRRLLRRARSKWWAWEDLNFRPHAYQARALTN